MKAVIIILLVPLVSALVMAYRSHQAESSEERTLATFPPSVQHVVTQMDWTTQAAFFNEYWQKRRKPSIGYLAWFFLGFHYLYARKVGVQIFFWLTCFFAIGVLWWIVDFFRIPSIMRTSNEQIARECLQTLHIATAYKAPPTVDPTTGRQTFPPPSSAPIE
jgi:TM2 domain-containing membrane protein YozV